jgi:hypothetical protein
MKNFSTWVQNINEAFGIAPNAPVRDVKQEIYGIRETLKNTLAQSNLSAQWGQIGDRIRKLEGSVPPELLKQAVQIYNELATEMQHGYRNIINAGAEDATLSTAVKHERRTGDSGMRREIENTLQICYKHFQALQKVLFQM